MESQQQNIHAQRDRQTKTMNTHLILQHFFLSSFFFSIYILFFKFCYVIILKGKFKGLDEGRESQVGYTVSFKGELKGNF